MKDKVKEVYWIEISKGKILFQKHDFSNAFKHFERSHILGQSNPLYHSYSHFCMLKVGLARKDLKEIYGQLFRIVGGFLGSLIGFYPHGNTGGSNVSAFKKMEIPDDLLKILNEKK